MAITVGAGAADYNSEFGIYNYTVIDKTNPANADGTLDVFEVFLRSADAAAFKIGTLRGSGADWTARDYELIGAVTQGSKQTFTGKNCDVRTNDIIGCYEGTNSVSAELNTSGGSGVLYKNEDCFAMGGGHTYTSVYADGKLGIYAYATGTETSVGNFLFMF